MGSSDQPPPLLHGIRVLSLGAFVAGNVLPLLLAELGADVVKVESDRNPEALRAYDTPGQPAIVEPSGIRTTALFAGMTRSVRSIAIAMDTPVGAAAFRALAARAHVVIENLAPGKMASWGCDWSDLTQDNPRLVMISISGYGRTGPLAGYKAYASNINNYLGLTSAWSIDGTLFDFVAAIQAAGAIVAGLTAVDRGSEGVFIDMAQTEAGASLLAPLYVDFLANGRTWDVPPNVVPGAALSCVVACAGADHWAAIELEDDSDWEVMCRHLARPDLVAGHGTTGTQRQELTASIASWARTRTSLQVALDLQGIGLAAAPVLDSEELWRDAQHRSRGAWVEVHHPDVGPLEYPRVLHRLSKTPARVVRPGPRLGAHTREVLEEWLGLPAAVVGQWEDEGGVWQAVGSDTGGEVDAGDQ